MKYYDFELSGPEGCEIQKRGVQTVKKAPLVLEIKGNSLDDGPGIRSVVFLKGCPLSCSWCHNPESKKAVAEISFDASDCVGCETCINTCEKGALSKENLNFIDRALCDLCFECVANCPSGALEQMGREIPVNEIVEKVIRDKPFFDTSNGGVTFSGGEPTLSMEFLAQAAKTFKEQDVHVLIETCGHFNNQSFIELVYPYTDLIYYDLKIMDSSAHKTYCGLPNETILDNFRKLVLRYQAGGVEILPRTPLIPGITDTDENLSAIASFLGDIGVKKIQLMSYHPLWLEKNTKIGIKSSAEPGVKMKEWMSDERVRACEKIFISAGIQIEN